MALRTKLKELRVSRNMTQESVAEHLGVSSQTVSKWERGLLSPDITLLPKIAVLFKCSIDSLFDMGVMFESEHKREFESKIKELQLNGDMEGLYHERIHEIRLNPDHYSVYPEIMGTVLRGFSKDKERIETMISLADHAEQYCTDDDIRNEIYRMMLQLCSESGYPEYKEKSRYYYNKLPMLKHSREIYAVQVMNGEEHRIQVRKNLINLIDMAECSIRQLILPEMPPEEKLFYYMNAAALYETVTDGKYAGFYDLPLLSDYCKIACIYVQLGKTEEARAYVDRIMNRVEKHINGESATTWSVFMQESSLLHPKRTKNLCSTFLKYMTELSELELFRNDICRMKE